MGIHTTRGIDIEGKDRWIQGENGIKVRVKGKGERVVDGARKDKKEGNSEEGINGVRQKWMEGGLESGTERGREDRRKRMEE